MSTEKVQSYSEAFLRITEATGIADVDVLVATFVNAEDENYRLFKYVEEVNQEVFLLPSFSLLFSLLLFPSISLHLSFFCAGLSTQ